VEALRIEDGPIQVRELEVRWASATGEFPYFKILRGELAGGAGREVRLWRSGTSPPEIVLGEENLIVSRRTGRQQGELACQQGEPGRQEDYDGWQAGPDAGTSKTRSISSSRRSKPDTSRSEPSERRSPPPGRSPPRGRDEIISDPQKR
jgi:hypothetical protein